MTALVSFASVMLRNENPKIVGLLFTENFKLFRKGSFYPLGTVDGFPFIDGEAKIYGQESQRDLYGAVLKKTLAAPFEMDVRAIVGRNGSGKSTILAMVGEFMTGKIEQVENWELPKRLREGFYAFRRTKESPDGQNGAILITNFDLLSNNRRISGIQKNIRYIRLETGDYSLDELAKSNEIYEYAKNEIMVETLSLSPSADGIRRIAEIRTHTPSSKKKADKQNILRIGESLTLYLSDPLGRRRFIEHPERRTDFFFFNYLEKTFFSHNHQEWRAYLTFWWFFYLSWIANSTWREYDKYFDTLRQELLSVSESLLFTADAMKALPYEDFRFSPESNAQIGTFIHSDFIDRFVGLFKNGKGTHVDGKAVRNLLNEFDINFQLSIDAWSILIKRLDGNPGFKKGGDGTAFYEFFQTDYEPFLEEARRFGISEMEIKEHFIFGADIRITPSNGPEYSLAELSDGQKRMIGFLVQLYDELVDGGEERRKDILIMIDEPEEKLHLEWQRQFLYYLLKNIGKFGNLDSSTILLATHSPYVIGDISKERVLFLERGKNKLDGYYESIPKEFSEISQSLGITNTFMGNIPEISRSGFFLDKQYGEIAERFVQALSDRKDSDGVFSDVGSIREIVGDRRLFEYLLLKNLTSK